LKKLLVISFLITNFLSGALSQNDTAHLNKKRFIPLIAGMSTVYTGSMIYLGHAWYKNNPQMHFHFFNDNAEWLQMDKCGHFTTSFHESVFVVEALKWSGVSKKKAIIFGSFAGLLFQTPIEILDGYSSGYGASWGDELANTTGSLLVLSQYLLWDQIRFQPKFSFHSSGFAPRNPNLLGKSSLEQILKDYNGQTYWMSFNIHSFLKNKENSRFPRWLNFAVGYGANNMIYARKFQNNAIGFMPYRQYYLSFDVDMKYVKTKKKWIKYLLYPLNFIHIPFPSVEFNRKGIHLDAF
jgi:uncharacterized protein YfiM (DUF2279 family)